LETSAIELKLYSVQNGHSEFAVDYLLKVITTQGQKEKHSKRNALIFFILLDYRRQ